MLIQVVEVQKSWLVIEFNDSNNLIQRKYIPRNVIDVTIKGTYNVNSKFLRYCIEYSDVDLVNSLGANYNGIDVTKLQDKLRNNGFWKKEDYIKMSQKINGILSVFGGKLKLNILLNASQV